MVSASLALMHHLENHHEINAPMRAMPLIKRPPKQSPAQFVPTRQVLVPH
ncbi:Uncharacterised protein [Vibrio cholerae]|nr:Uncharacterised protein [Vibrio cholerae]